MSEDDTIRSELSFKDQDFYNHTTKRDNISEIEKLNE